MPPSWCGSASLGRPPPARPPGACLGNGLKPIHLSCSYREEKDFPTGETPHDANQEGESEMAQIKAPALLSGRGHTQARTPHPPNKPLFWFGSTPSITSFVFFSFFSFLFL